MTDVCCESSVSSVVGGKYASEGESVMDKDGEDAKYISSCRSRPMSHPDDAKVLTDILCLMRSQLEVFVVSLDDGDLRFRQMAGKVGVGRVGIRCIHCTRNQSKSGNGTAPTSRNGAVSYPKSIRLVYQSVKNWQRYHFYACTAMPESVKERYKELKSSGKQHKSSRASTRYWEDSCRRIGMVDSDLGIKLRLGRFLSDDEQTKSETDEYTEQGTRELGPVDSNIPSFGKRNGRAPVGTIALSQSSDTGAVSKELVPPLDGDSNVKETKESVSLVRSANHERERHDTLKDIDTYERNANLNVDNEGLLAGNAQISVRGMASPRPSVVLEEQSIHPGETSTNRGIGNGDAVGPPFPGTIQDYEVPVERDATCPSPAPQQNTSPTPAVSSQQGRLLQSGLPSALSRSVGSNELSKEAVLDRVKVAIELVHAVTHICFIEVLGETGTIHSELNKPKNSDFNNLGAELYQLFSGEALSIPSRCGRRHETLTDWVDFAAAEDLFEAVYTEDDDGHIQQQQKKRDIKSKVSYTPLHDLGLPAALCTIVSDLIDHYTGNENNVYESLEQVEQDLRLIATAPEKYLVLNNSGSLRLSQSVICGRDEETSLLLETRNNMESNESTMVLISGYSGTGKTALIQSVQSAYMKKGACFVSGKFDEMMQPQPLSAIASALDDYCGTLATNENRLNCVREAVAAAIGSEGTALVGLIPNLGKLLCANDAPPIQLTGREAFQRILFMIRMLFWATCSRSNPVVLFLDDLQWADPVSLELMQVLVADTMIEGLLFVGSYRDNEVSADHPLMMHVDSIRRSGNVSIVPIHIGNLDSCGVISLVSNTLHLLPRTTRPLAEVIMNKTGGNALFVVQFLASLYDEGFLRYSLTSRRWEWDIEQIRNKDIADNVVELMTAKLLRLGEEVQEALSVAAGFGATCQKSLLLIIDRSPDVIMSTVMALDVAVTEGLMVKTDDMYRFSHDQIQRASYLLIPDSKREAFHLRIGRLLWKLSSNEETEKYLFVVVDQLHRGSSLIIDCDEKVNLAQLSLLAAQMATGMSGFSAAAAYLKAGIALVANDDWERHRDLCFDLHNSCAETEYILGDFEGMNGHLEEVLRRSITLEEKLKAYFILVSSSGSQGRTGDAINTTITVLAHLGEPFPSDVNGLAVKQEIMKTQKLLLARKWELDQMELMVDPVKLEAMKFLHRLMTYAYSANREYYVMITCRMLQLTLFHGICKESAVGFAAYGGIVCSLLDDLSGGDQIGKLALSIANKFQCKEVSSRARLIAHCLIFLLTQPMQASLAFLKESIDICMSFGRVDPGIVAYVTYVITIFFSGEPLRALIEEMQVQDQKMATLVRHGMQTMIKPLRQAVLNLLGRSRNPIELIGEEMDESYLSLYTEESSNYLFYYYFRMWLAYLFGEYEQCWEIAKSSLGNIAKNGIHNINIQRNYPFYSGLAALALARMEHKDEYLKAISTTMAKLEKWAASAPWNCQHKLELMKAEYAYLQRNIVLAAKMYDVAIETAAKHSFQHEQALALERAGIFYLECGDHDAAFEYFKRAHDCYYRWGAMSKAEQIKEQWM
eukprot:CAMPEP_0113595088 /NCGR_PEP_ID=MMETSP0015_2-20120614/39452_1 /TAXON_ID=2838 /ORGANISM="Odontella" /LENGTH=1563 /DNA_ID=CAMNT_0000502185 /DNA_START=77 /DNA_END=4769 /DNA_ORIENTATION=+ /assembly_acc=CAM_ASM_000160